MIHQLAEKVGVVCLGAHHLRQTVDQARYVPGIPVEVLNALVDTLKVLADLNVACGQAVVLFDRLRKVC